jgi:hypothetical protein
MGLAIVTSLESTATNVGSSLSAKARLGAELLGDM